jgi:hypothetical protein
MSRYRERYMDPEGRRHGGMPTYAWRCAPKGQVTRRQLRKLGLRPAGQQPCGQILWGSARVRQPGQAPEPRIALLYRVDLAAPIRPMTPGRWRTHEAMMRTRRTCPSCGGVFPHDLSRKYKRTCSTCLEAEGVRV